MSEVYTLKFKTITIIYFLKLNSGGLHLVGHKGNVPPEPSLKFTCFSESLHLLTLINYF